jgi:hypothetical protein
VIKSDFSRYDLKYSVSDFSGNLTCPDVAHPLEFGSLMFFTSYAMLFQNPGAAYRMSLRWPLSGSD